ncbi:DnaJ domain-containing protein, partial [Rhizobium sp. SIMBA_035]
MTATEKEIKAAYRKAARVSHPDHGGEAEMFRRVTLAYETLIDPERRADYDRRYGAGDFQHHQSRPGDYQGARAPGPSTTAHVRRD